MTDRQWSPFNTSGVQSPSEAHPRPRDLESGTCSKAHDVCHPHQLAPLGAFLHLARDQSFCHLPPEYFPPLARHLEPLSNMSGQSIEGQIEAVTGEKGDAARCKEVPQGVHHRMRRMWCTWTKMEHGKKRACRGRWPATARAPVYSCVAWSAVHPTACAGAEGWRKSACATSERASPRGTATW